MADSFVSADAENVAAIESSLEEVLGERLISAGRIDARSLDRATRLRAESGDRLYQVLTKLGMVTERDMAEVLAEVRGLSLARPDDYPAHKVLEALRPKTMAPSGTLCRHAARDPAQERTT